LALSPALVVARERRSDLPGGPDSVRPFEGIGLIYVNRLRCSEPIVDAALPLMIAIVVALAIALLMRETYPKPRSL
jgi:hypothetical protein